MCATARGVQVVFVLVAGVALQVALAIVADVALQGALATVGTQVTATQVALETSLCATLRRAKRPPWAACRLGARAPERYPVSACLVVELRESRRQ
eukprot:7547501-Alexandrium_andersonii.AAC.1